MESDQRGLTGLYDPRDERDACGFGLIAQLDDRPSPALVRSALEALARMTHRGGVAADELLHQVRQHRDDDAERQHVDQHGDEDEGQRGAAPAGDQGRVHVGTGRQRSEGAV